MDLLKEKLELLGVVRATNSTWQLQNKLPTCIFFCTLQLLVQIAYFC